MSIRHLCFGILAVVLLGQVSWAATPEAPRSWIVCFRDAGRLPDTANREEVIRFLQNRLAGNLEAVRANLRKDAAIRPLWIANAAALAVTPREAARLAELPNVERVLPDRNRCWIKPGFDWAPFTPSQTKANPWSAQKVNAPQVWNEFKVNGAGVVVGIIDTGIFEGHSALKGKVLKFKDFSPAALPDPYDDMGHGTHTAGSIVGGEGVGVAPGARLIVAKVFDKTGNADDSWVLAAMQWTMDPDGDPKTNDGPRLISNSWGSNDTTDKVFWNASKAWAAAGILPVFAAGNNGPNGLVATPGNFPHSWAVGAVTKDDNLAGFSSIGPIVWDGVKLTKPDIAAPGAFVISCGIKGTLVFNSGTSMACPHVAGLAALMYQAKPKLTIQQVRTLAEATAVDLGEPGKDNKFGAGRIDAYACLKKVLATRDIAENFAAYEDALVAERALTGIGPVSPLAAPLADALLRQVTDLDEGEFRSLASHLPANSPAAALLSEARGLRVAQSLHH